MSLNLTAYVDSAEEQLAFLLSRFGPQETWTVAEQRMASDPGGESVERTSVETPGGQVGITFRDAHPVITFSETVEEQDRTAALDPVMERASRFAAENPPHHPGSLPRFPVPIEHYDRAVAVPLPILAVDDLGRRGLFAPPRMAVVSWDTTEPMGVREFDDFDPGSWPPRRLGDWPVESVSRLAPDVLKASIQRFSACWSRVIDAWFETGGRARSVPKDDLVLRSDVEDALRLRAILDLPAMSEVYRSMNPRFDGWLQGVK